MKSKDKQYSMNNGEATTERPFGLKSEFAGLKDGPTNKGRG